MRRIAFLPAAFDDFVQWETKDKRVHARIVKLIKDIERDPFVGIGKPDPARLRPTDRMVAHTGFLIFGRRVEMSEEERVKDLLEER